MNNHNNNRDRDSNRTAEGGWTRVDTRGALDSEYMCGLVYGLVREGG